MKFWEKKQDDTEKKSKDAQLFNKALIKEALEFDKLKEEGEAQYKKAIFCPHISGGVGNRYGDSFADYYCIHGMPTSIFKNTFRVEIPFDDSNGERTWREVPKETRKQAGERWETEPEAFMKCPYWQEDDCKLLRLADP